MQSILRLSDGLITAEIRKSLDIEGLKQNIKAAFAGLNIREQKTMMYANSSFARPTQLPSGIASSRNSRPLRCTERQELTPSRPHQESIVAGLYRAKKEGSPSG